jgi:hypothetical protein
MWGECTFTSHPQFWWNIYLSLVHKDSVWLFTKFKPPIFSLELCAFKIPMKKIGDMIYLYMNALQQGLKPYLYFIHEPCLCSPLGSKAKWWSVNPCVWCIIRVVANWIRNLHPCYNMSWIWTNLDIFRCEFYRRPCMWDARYKTHDFNDLKV